MTFMENRSEIEAMFLSLNATNLQIKTIHIHNSNITYMHRLCRTIIFALSLDVYSTRLS